METTIKKTEKSKHNVKTKAIVKNHKDKLQKMEKLKKQNEAVTKAIVKDHENQVLQMTKFHTKELKVCN